MANSSKRKVGLKKGDVVDIDWLDPCTDGNGDPKKAKLANPVDTGRWFGYVNCQGKRCAVIYLSIDSEGDESGWTIVPTALINSIKKAK